MNAKQAFKKVSNSLENAGIETSDFEAQCLIKKVLGFDRTALIAHGDTQVDDCKLDELNGLIKRRINREPLQYILGTWSFCGFEFEVGEGVLIPRDDTEVVLNLCLDFLKTRQSKKVLDLCAGSGAISVAIEKLAKADVTGIELSDKAFEYLLKNIKLNNSCVKPFKGDIFKCYKYFSDNEFDLIVSNPPYIRTDDISSLQIEVKKEPAMALDGGTDGFDFYRAIIEFWCAKLKNGGALAFELGENQAKLVESLMKSKGFKNITVMHDLGGIKRAIIGTAN